MRVLLTFLIFTTILHTSCSNTTAKPQPSSTMDTTYQYTNELIHETSPYLLQHAHNPVNWYPWGEKALEKAKKENKLLLISVGYAACHWCHVMEHESFEKEDVAKIMNQYFVCIKVDREERPDIDQIYMDAVHLMNQRGGWPLNCFATADGKPFYGGTYFPKEQWIDILQKIHNEYVNSPEKVQEYAEKLAEGVAQNDLIQLNKTKADFSTETLQLMLEKWENSFDNKEGGSNRAPKFPLPNNYEFLLQYATLSANEKLKKHVFFTLDKMAFGGIYDQIGGGFARYSTDIKWKVPHFEKMLYDNGQLISLYAKAYQASKKELYKTIVFQTIEFVERELMSQEYAFYSSLDADSEGEEGKFYVWKKHELQAVLGADFELFASYYNVNKIGFWEEGNYILLRKEGQAVFAKNNQISEKELNKKVNLWKKRLLNERSKRVRPGLDDKTLTSWNALMLKGLVDAYVAFGEPHFLDLALKNAHFISKNQKRTDGGLNHNFKNGTSNINGYLEDYSFTIEAFIALYQASADEKWLHEANQLMEYTIQHFYDKKSGMFFFTSDLDPALIARKMEISDNVIPASCSGIAKDLFLLGHLLDNSSYIQKYKTMLNNVKEFIPNYGSGYSNWGIVLANTVFPAYEVAIIGKQTIKNYLEFNQKYMPNVLYLTAKKASDLPLLENKFVEHQTTIYVCENKACLIPVTKVEEALKQIK